MACSCTHSRQGPQTLDVRTRSRALIAFLQPCNASSASLNCGTVTENAVVDGSAGHCNVGELRGRTSGERRSRHSGGTKQTHCACWASVLGSPLFSALADVQGVSQGDGLPKVRCMAVLIFIVARCREQARSNQQLGSVHQNRLAPATCPSSWLCRCAAFRVHVKRQTSACSDFWKFKKGSQNCAPCMR